ncbi:MAG: HD family phosphohydrolase [Muribaculaceae bacterium]|nr:HD family phosphohydrolase [Muribaculaceae bacterium]
MDKKELFELKEQFISLLKSTTLEDVDLIVKDLEDLGFFKAPASAKNHLCYEGGLLIHSLNVYEAAMKIKEAFATARPDIFDTVSDESIIIASLLHDVCKASAYVGKPTGRYELGESSYNYNNTDLPVGHGEKSVIMLLRMGVGLSDAEICAIRWHMGPWAVNDSSAEEKGAYRTAEKLYPLVSIIHMADTAAAHILERPYTTIN